MKKVLIVACNDLGNGGVQHVIMDIVRNLSDKFHFDIVLFSDKESYYEPEFKKYGRIFRIPHKGANGSFRSKLDKYIRFHRLYLGIKKILKENGPYDIIHCHMANAAYFYFKVAKKYGIKVNTPTNVDQFFE